MENNSPETTSPLSDEALVAMSCGGDNEATDILLTRFSPAVRYYAASFSARNVNADASLDSDDYGQFGLLGLCSAISAYRADRNTSFRTFATTCILNAMKTAARKHGAGGADRFYTSVQIDELTNIPDGKPGPESEFLTSELMKEIHGVIDDKLSDFERTVLFGFIEGKSYKQIAEENGRTAKSVDGALQRARKKIADICGETK